MNVGHGVERKIVRYRSQVDMVSQVHSDNKKLFEPIVKNNTKNAFFKNTYNKYVLVMDFVK